MAGDTGLEAIEPFLREIMDSVEPRPRKQLADKLMRLARRVNAQRIARNVTPEGDAMVPRKARRRKGKMFRRIGKAGSLNIRTTPDMGELRFANPLVEGAAATHHHGLEGFVGKTPRGRVIRTRYQARELLGFGPEADQFLDEVLRHFSHSS